MATYDRADVLRHAVRSAIAQRYTDWEMLIVGDACTDDTADVVASFGDPRVGFVNLPINVGEQSGPNNVGIARTDAPLVAFLNHDDLWFPDHLERLVAVLQARHADLVFSPNFNVAPHADRPPGTIVLDGLPRHGRFDPRLIDRAFPASGWLVTRAALERLGGWRSADECRVEPSQDLLFRAHRAGMRLCCAGPPTVVCIAAGTRPGSYRSGGDAEHAWFAERLERPSFKAELFAAAAWSEASGHRPERPRALSAWFAALGGLARLGVSPRAADAVLRGRRRRGDLLRQLRQRRGLAAVSALAADPDTWRDAEVAACCGVDLPASISFAADGEGTRFCSHGWSQPEAWGTWSTASRASLAVRPLGADPATLRLTMIAHVDDAHPGQRVVIEPGGQVETLHGHGPHTVTIAVEAGRTNWITLSFPDRWSPATTDARQLAVGLLHAEVVSTAGADHPPP